MSLQRLYDLFDRACDLDPRAQAAFVARECAGDPALADRLRALLRAEQQVPSSFLDNALDVTVAPAELATDTGPPEHIGPYRVLREIGRGGMGVVYEAEQEQPRRRVAVKVLRRVTASDEGLKRFEREARVLGRLSHPGIAHIYDAGSALVGDEVWPYFAMEFIEGRRLDDYLDVSGADRTARLRLFVEICDAVEHAHFHRIVHRDLKPANILVVESPTTGSASTITGHAASMRTVQPKILDFGVARVTEGSLASTSGRTGAGQILGTLGYMSPEQLSGGTRPVDARSDVYALGVVLYFVLSGRLPYDLQGKTALEILRLIQEEEPRPIGTIDATLRGDVETIVTKALQKEPDDRYPSAAALAWDIRRHLVDEPVTTRPSRPWRRAVSFAGRHRGFVGVLAALFIGLLAGLLVATSGLSTAQRQRDDAEAAVGFLADMLEASPPGSPGQPPTVRQVLDRAAEHVGERFRGAPWVEAKLRTTIGTAYASLGRPSEAQAQLRRAVDLWTEVGGSDDLNTLDARAELGLSFHLQEGSQREARLHLEEALIGYRRVLPVDDPRPVRVLKDLANIAAREGRLHEARQLFEEAFALQRRTLDADDRVAMRLVESFASHLIRTGEYDPARKLLEEHLERCQRLLGLEHAETRAAAAKLSLLTDALVAQKRFDEAEPLLLLLYEASSAKHRPDVVQRLVQLYDAWNRPVAAAHWRGVAGSGDVVE